MNHTVRVRVIQRIGNFGGDSDRVLDGKELLAVQPVAQRFAFDERHHVVEHSAGFAGIVQRHDVRMLEIRRRPDLGEKSLRAERRREVGMQHLERDLPVVAYVLGEINGGHSATPELAVNAVAISERWKFGRGGLVQSASAGGRNSPREYGAGRPGSHAPAAELRFKLHADDVQRCRAYVLK